MRIATTADDHHCHCSLFYLTKTMRESRGAVTPDLQPRPSDSSSLARLNRPVKKPFREVRSSATWTSTSGDLGVMSDTDEIRDRRDFVLEYNRLAQKVCSPRLHQSSPS